MSQTGHKITGLETCALFSTLDLDNDDVLNYSEFLNGILPKNFTRPTKFVCYEYRNRQLNYQDNAIQFMLEDLSKLFLEIIDSVFKVDSIRLLFNEDNGLSLAYYFR